MKRLSYYFYALAGIILAVVSSCSKEHLYVNNPNLDGRKMMRSAYSKEELNQMRKDFGEALAKALKESSSLRVLIKKKALEMIDNDYDVLYHLIKNERLENDISVKELIGKYYKDKNGLKSAEKLLPTLTIMVPTLPMNSFSAEIWNADSQIPIVGVTSTQTNDVTMIDANGKEFVLEAKYFPSFPVLVVKECERIVASDSPEYSKVNSTSKLVSQDGEFQYKFIDDAFDGKLAKKKKNGGRLAYDFNTDQKIKDAAIIFPGFNNWQRDYIYYDLTPTVDKGPFSNEFTETITTFRIDGNDVSGTLSQIADQTNDPKFVPVTPLGGSPNSFWTSGSFSFKVKCLLNSTNGTGAERFLYFDCRPDQLFYLTYDSVQAPHNLGSYYVVRDILPIPLALNLPIFKWDLQQYSYGVRISIEEIDDVITTTITDQQISKFATNFGIDAGVIKKIGLKFGANFSEDRTQTIQRVVTQGNDPMGDADIVFDDPIITDHDPVAGTYIIKEFTGGRFWITLEPKK